MGHRDLPGAHGRGGSAATKVGQNLGAGRPDRFHRVAWVAPTIAAAILSSCSVVLFVSARLLIRVLNTDRQVVGIGAHYLRIVSPFYLFTAVGIVLGRALNGAGDSLPPP